MIDEKLSFDLYYRIFEELTFQDRVRCTSVSQRWRDILLGQWPGMWRHIEYTEANRVEARASPLENEAFFAWLTRAPADGVWSLTCYGDPAFYNTLVRILHRKRFPQLKTLRITCKLEKLTHRRHLPLSPPKLDPHKLLTSEIECLEIAQCWLAGGFGKGLASVLAMCPRLTCLTLRDLTVFSVAPAMIFPQHTSLTHLHWLNRTILPLSLINQFPNLRSLVIWDFALRRNLTEFTANVNQWCPQLKVLEVQRSETPPPEQHDYQGHSMSHHDGATQPGIEKLILQPRWLDRGLTTTDLILRNRHTLLYLKTFPDEVYLESLIEMPCLRHLHLEHAESNQWLILDLLMVCPSLQILHLNSLSGKSEEGEEGFSVPLPYLQKIYLNDCSCLGSSFFHSLDNLNALTEVSMYGCHSITEQGRKALLAKAPNLKTIHYYPWKDKSSPSDHYLLGPAQMGRTIQWEL